ncbi:MAG: hypothetical protein ACLPVF_05910 [Acidimicrobiales bacterium]
MSEIIDALVLDLIEWIGPGQRPYAEVMEAWRTSCPRLPVWEEANRLGLIVRHHDAVSGEVMVSVTAVGAEYLRLHRPTATAAV